MLADRAVGRQKSLGMTDRFEAPHPSFPLPSRLVGIFGLIVQALVLPVFHGFQDLFLGCPIAGQFVGHDHSRHVPQSLQQFTEELLGRRLVATLLHQDVQDVPFLVHRPPQIGGLAIDFEDHFVEMPLVAGLWTAVADLVGVDLAKLAPSLLAVLLACLLLAITSYSLLDRQAHRALKRSREAWDQMVVYFDALIQGSRELKLHRPRRQVFWNDHLIPHAQTMRAASIQGEGFYVLALSWGQILPVLLIGLVLFVLPGLDGLETGVLTAYTLVVIQLTGAIGTLLETLPGLGRASVALSKVEALRTTLGAEPAQEGRPPLAHWQRLELVGITHRYISADQETFTLGPINLVFRPGELVFLAGGNGSGKTTLAKLISGLYTPEAGAIYLDGEPVGDHYRDDYRQLFTVLFADGYLFEHLFGLDEMRAAEYLTLVELDQRVQVEGGRFSTTALSQGQRKRLSLLTAYLEDRPFYIFDEWAANQDPQFRELFYQEMLPVLKARGKTVLVISHDDRYYPLADTLLKLDEGRLHLLSSRQPAPDPC